ncbi:MAG: hypothetical protein ACE5JI_12455 [Acidobacteriota bacterium]
MALEGTSETSRTSNGAARVDRSRQWMMRLAIGTSAVVLIMALTGLSIWILPFSTPNQVQVFLNTLVGLLFLLPVSWYLLRHWLTYRRNLMTHIKLLGYVGVFALILCNVSGLVLTWQALVGPSISYTWDGVHIVTTFAVLAFVLPHIVVIVVRDRKARASGVATPVAATSAHGQGGFWTAAVCLRAAPPERGVSGRLQFQIR